MPADIVERPQHAIAVAHDRDRLAGDLDGEKRAGSGELIQPADGLPAGEYRRPLALGESPDRNTNRSEWYAARSSGKVGSNRWIAMSVLSERFCEPQLPFD